MSEQLPEFQENTIDAILDTAKTIYNEESERFKQAESKTGIALAIVGVLFGAYLTYLGTFEPITKETSYLIYTYIFKLLIFVCFSLGIIFLLRSIRTGQYEQVSLKRIAVEEFGRESPDIAKLGIALTYKEAINNNKGIIENKLAIYNKGLTLVYWGFVFLSIHFLIEGVINSAG